VLTSAADDFIRTTQGPLFLEFSTNLPHAPALPEPRFAHAFSELAPPRPPSFNESDVSDKPAYIRNRRPFTPGEVRGLDDLYRDQYRSLLSVDDSVGRLIDAMRDTGRLDDALVIFTSDNGLLFGQHRWAKKEVPYEESIRVPLAIRDDQFARAGVTDPRFALNIDLAPTIAEIAGVDPPHTDGMSLVPILRGEDIQWRDRFLVEHYEGANPIPTYCALRTTDEMYIRYVDGEEELYDLAWDPYELKNLAEVPEEQSRRVQIAASLDALCVPPPPGFGGGGVSWTGAAVAFAGVAAAALGRRSVRRSTPSLDDQGETVG
jgi:arylsulfatase A-like enzyme